MRKALGDAAPLYRDAPEAQAAHTAIRRTFDAFVAEVLPDAPRPVRSLASDLVQATLFTVGEHASERPRGASIKAYGEAMADMLCGYLQGVAQAAGPATAGRAVAGPASRRRG